MPSSSSGPIYCLFSVNSPICAEAIHLLEALLIGTHKGVRLRFLDKGEGLPVADATDDGTACLLVSHFPNAALMDALRARGIEPLIAVDNPANAVAQHVRSPESFWTALRSTSECYTALATMALRGPSFLLSKDMLDMSFVDLMARIGTALGLPDVEPHLDTVLSIYLGRPNRRAERRRYSCRYLSEIRRRVFREPLPFKAPLSDFQLRQVDLVITPSWEILMGGSVRSFVWSHETFFDGDERGQGLPQTFSLTGPSRCVGYGPYFHLPAGTWTAQIVFGVSKRACGIALRFDVHNGEICGTLNVRPAKAGFFTAQTMIRIERPDEPVHLTITTLSGAIHGLMTLRMVVLTPEGGRPPEIEIDPADRISVRGR